MSLVGQSAPLFTLVDTGRKPISLESYRGKKVLLAFFPAAFTGVCERELCAIRDAFVNLARYNAEVLGISVDSPFANAAFATKNELNYPLLSDYSRYAVTHYGVAHEDFAGLPSYTAAKRSIFLINEEGVVTYEWVAPNPGVEPDYDAVAAAVAGVSVG